MLESILASIAASTVAMLLVAALGRSWLEARVRAAVDHEYKIQFEVFRRSLDQRQKVELVAELLAEYMRTPYGETVPREQRTVLNRLSLQASLWLPAELAIELSKRLQNKPDAKTAYDLILLARQQLIGDSTITSDHVTLWNMLRESIADPVLVRPGTGA